MAQMERKEKIRVLRLVLAEAQLFIMINTLSDSEQSNFDLLIYKSSEKEIKRLLNKLDKNCQYPL